MPCGYICACSPKISRRSDKLIELGCTRHLHAEALRRGGVYMSAVGRDARSAAGSKLACAALVHMQEGSQKESRWQPGGRTTAPTRPRRRAQDVTCLTGDADETARSRPNRGSDSSFSLLSLSADVPTRDICRRRHLEPIRSKVNADFGVLLGRRSKTFSSFPVPNSYLGTSSYSSSSPPVSLLSSLLAKMPSDRRRRLNVYASLHSVTLRGGGVDSLLVTAQARLCASNNSAVPREQRTSTNLPRRRSRGTRWSIPRSCRRTQAPRSRSRSAGALS